MNSNHSSSPRGKFDRKTSFSGPRKSFGDRDGRPAFGNRGPRPTFGDRKPFGDRPSFGDRGPRPSFGDRASHSSFGNRSRPSFGDKKPFGDRGPRQSFGDRKPSFGPRKSFDERPKSGEDRFPTQSQYRVKRDFSQDFDKQDTSKSISRDQMKDAMASASNSEDVVRPRKQKSYMREESGFAQKKAETSWGEVASWYDNHLENDEDTYHNKVILPNLSRLISVNEGERVLDIACGQGFFTRRFQEANPNTIFEGVDLGEDLIKVAKKRSPKITYNVGNAEDLSQYQDNTFDKAYIVLAIQNIEHLDKLIGEAFRILKTGGTFHIVMNHPAFRIPKETSWEYVDEKGIQARRVDAYLSDSKSEMDMHPGMFNSPKTLSFHRSMQTYFKQLAKFGFAVDRLEEWISHKISDNGPRMDAENKARKEIPMFMYMRAKKY